MLIPNNKQKTKLFKYANTARFAYNWTIAREQKNYKDGNKFISDGDLRKEFTQLKKTDGYEWLNEISNNVTKQAIKDACRKEPSISVPAINWLYTTDLIIMCGLDRTYIIKKFKDEIQRRKRK